MAKILIGQVLRIQVIRNQAVEIEFEKKICELYKFFGVNMISTIIMISEAELKSPKSTFLGRQLIENT